jgi:hypothetical protein
MRLRVPQAGDVHWPVLIAWDELNCLLPIADLSWIMRRELGILDGAAETVGRLDGWTGGRRGER